MSSLAAFLSVQLDYIYFFYGAGFFLLWGVCRLMDPEDRRILPWPWLGWFGLTHGIHEWLHLINFWTGTTPVWNALLEFFFSTLSFFTLLEFGRAGLSSRWLRPWLHGLLFSLLMAWGAVYGLIGMKIMSRYLLATAGAGLSALAFWTASRHDAFRGRWLKAASLLVAIYGVLSSVAAGVFAWAIAGVLWIYSRAPKGAEQQRLGRSCKRCSIGGLAALTLVVLAGWLLTDWVGRHGPTGLTFHQYRLLGIALMQITILFLIAFLVHHFQITLASERCAASGQQALGSLKLLQELIDAVPAPIFYMNREGCYLGCNLAFAKMLGRPKDEIAGRTMFELNFPEKPHEAHEADQALFRLPGVHIYEAKVQYPDATIRDMVFYKATYLNEAGEAAGLVGTYLDVTDRKQAEEIVFQAKKRYEELVNNLPIGVYRNTPGAGGRFLEANLAFVKMLEAESRAELLRTPVDRLYRDSSHRDRFDAQLMAEGEVRQQSLEWISLKGKPLVVEISAVKRENERGEAYFDALAKDVTEQRRLHDVLQQSEKLSAVGRLAAGVAHEINNPLNVILGYAQTLAQKCANGDPAAHALRTIEQETRRCAGLVRNLLGFSRLHAPSKTLEDLEPILETALTLVGPQLRLKRIELVRELGKGLPRVMAAFQDIQQIVINLCTNAIDAMPSGGRLTVRLLGPIPDPHGKQWLEIKVQDTGTGIPPETRQRIFEPFFTTKETGHGTGLGLSLAHEMVERHGGQILLDSELGHGSVFTIRLPIADDVLVRSSPSKP